jgi:hypothetical protein
MRVCVPLLALAIVAAVSCSGTSHLTNSAVSGAYEFVVTSNVTGSTTLVEADLAASSGQSTANGPNQVQILTLEKKTWYVNGICAGSSPGQNSLSLNVTGSNIGFALNEGGYAIPGAGVLTGSTITGNYTVTGSTCADLIGVTGYAPGEDTGGFVGNQVPALGGTFVGSLNLPDGTDNAAFTLTENLDYSLTVSAQLTGNLDNGTFQLTGTAIGNIMFVSGSVNGQNLFLLGYFDKVGAYTGTPNSLLVFNYDTLASAGLLLAQ